MPRRQVTIELDEFGYSELEAVAQEQGVSVEELIVHAAMYYLADAGNGRMATKVPRNGRAAEPEPS